VVMPVEIVIVAPAPVLVMVAPEAKLRVVTSVPLEAPPSLSAIPETTPVKLDPSP